MEKRIILLLSFAVALSFLSMVSAAHADCHAGQMTTLSSPLEVAVVEGKQELKTTLPPKTEVHIIEVTKDNIELYAMKDARGSIIGALASVKKTDSTLECQKQ